jgi:casein kinase II subunit beta
MSSLREGCPRWRVALSPFFSPAPTHDKLFVQIEKYKKGDFGRCPRVLCYGQSLLPLGLSDIPYQKAVKLYCPRCEDLYSPKSSRHGSIDGAYFGSTFAHMLFMVYPGMIPSKSVPGAGQGAGGQAGLSGGGLGAQAAAKVERIRPRIFGFQVHEHAKLLRWQEKIRDQCVILSLRLLRTS